MKNLYILDASGYIYRSYFAIRNMTNAKGESTNGLFGFIRSVMKLFKDFDPTHFVAVFDGPHNAKSREAIYVNYKAHRSAMPPDLLYQIQWAQQFCNLMGLPMMSVPGVEADDTMGSIAIWGAEKEADVYICSSDKDLCQLVNGKVKILNTFKDNLIMGSKEVEEAFGVAPEQIIDYLAITGDSSDNVPGVTGFGPKTASELLKKFGSLENLLANPSQIGSPKKEEALRAGTESALMSKKLVTLDLHVPFEKDEHFFEVKPPKRSELVEFYTQMKFHTLIKELEESLPDTTPQATQAPELKTEYILVDNETSLDLLLKELSKEKEICFNAEATSQQPMLAELVGIGLGVRPGQAWYIPMNGKLGKNKALEKLKPFFENPDHSFFGHNIKYDYHVLENHGIKISKLGFDTILASYVLNSQSRQHGLDSLSLELFGKVKTPLSTLVGKGKKEISMFFVPLPQVCEYCCEDVDYTIRIKEKLEAEIKERNLQDIFSNIEMPLSNVLGQMERHGIFLDTGVLSKLSQEVTVQIADLEKQIYTMAGEEFNLNSPKQLSQVLFEKLSLPAPRKTATGWSTDADVLEKLSEKFPIAKLIQEYRGLEKLRSTYIDSLPLEINPRTRRIHCTFNQSVAATGRLSCQNPNLQNIPVRSEMGIRIREAFRPEKEGWSYIGGDYSQIELRLMAHLSEDPYLMEAFRNGDDIHRYTAATLLGIPQEEVTKEQRQNAKAVNFGIIYGQGPFGLSQELGIDIKEASRFIEMYFKRYSKVKEFLETRKEYARETGRAKTSLGRERLIPEIHSKNPQIRAAAERLAINTPLQGMAADLIKMAMLNIDKKLKNSGLQGYMILQVHDELIFEVPDGEIPVFEALVKKEMQEVYPLNVPLLVDINIGKNWKEC